MSIKISIITVCYNSEKTIRDTILSVITQSYERVEYIIVDGNSKDNTLNIIKEYKEQIATIISEPDKGLYDAINKGIKIATGDVVGIINSDDIVAHQDVVKNIAKTFAQEKCDAIYGDLIYTDETLIKPIRTWKSNPYKKGLFLKGWMPAHPTFYAKKKAFELYGYYDTSFKISADYELMLRFMHKNNIKAAYIPEVLVKMRTGGVSNSSIKNRVTANLEDRRAWKINKVRPKLLTLIRKPLSKLEQFFD